MSVLRYVDAHLHLDAYPVPDQQPLVDRARSAGVERLISVSMNLASCKANLRLHRQFREQVRPAFGYHPEQPLPSAADLDLLLAWIRDHAETMVAVGEVGLPYYTRREAARRNEPLAIEPYIELLEQFIALASALDKPIVLHAVYDDADIALDLLERHTVARAHFHWFKGTPLAVERLIANGYFVSFTPDIMYEEEIQLLAASVPLTQIMVETDGPWPFEGPFSGQPTEPGMVAHVVRKLAAKKRVSEAEAAAQLWANTCGFFGI